MPRGNCNLKHHLGIERVQTGHFEKPRFPSSKYLRLNLTHLWQNYINLRCQKWVKSILRSSEHGKPGFSKCPIHLLWLDKFYNHDGNKINFLQRMKFCITGKYQLCGYFLAKYHPELPRSIVFFIWLPLGWEWFESNLHMKQIPFW